MKTLSIVAAASLLAVVAACGGSKEEKKAEPTVALVARPADDALVASCVKMREQLHLCKEQAIDMLMEERAKADKKLAAQFSDATKKAELRTVGLTELEADGAGDAATLTARTDKCKEMVAKVPAQIPQATLDAFNGLGACWDKPCMDRANCVRPFVAATVMPAPAAK